LLTDIMVSSLRVCLAGLVLVTGALLSGCASLPMNDTVIVSAALPDEEDAALTELMTVMRNDLTRATTRTRERDSLAAPRLANLPAPGTATTPTPRDVTRFFRPIGALPIPVVGLSSRDLDDNFGHPRDGGRRRHRGIDIFAPRGREIVSVADGYVSFVGTQPKGGLCVWVVNEDGYSFYYAHLDSFAPGLAEGMEIRRGDLLGYVGNTGNARGTSPHLHFAVLKDDEALNPYPLLTLPTQRAEPILGGGFTAAGGMNR
jgi:murein DD-endopeptidase MepM/ murein hydrolase activator NlpD